MPHPLVEIYTRPGLSGLRQLLWDSLPKFLDVFMLKVAIRNLSFDFVTFGRDIGFSAAYTEPAVFEAGIRDLLSRASGGCYVSMTPKEKKEFLDILTTIPSPCWDGLVERILLPGSCHTAVMKIHDVLSKNGHDFKPPGNWYAAGSKCCAMNAIKQIVALSYGEQSTKK